MFTVVWEIFAYNNFHVLIFRVKNFSDSAYLSEEILTRNFKTHVKTALSAEGDGPE